MGSYGDKFKGPPRWGGEKKKWRRRGGGSVTRTVTLTVTVTLTRIRIPESESDYPNNGPSWYSKLGESIVLTKLQKCPMVRTRASTSAAAAASASAHVSADDVSASRTERRVFAKLPCSELSPELLARILDVPRKWTKQDPWSKPPEWLSVVANPDDPDPSDDEASHPLTLMTHSS